MAENTKCTDKELLSELNDMILSASGWRKIFSPEGEEGKGKEITFCSSLLAAAMGLTWGTKVKTSQYFSPVTDSAGGKKKTL